MACSRVSQQWSPASQGDNATVGSVAREEAEGGLGDDPLTKSMV